MKYKVLAAILLCFAIVHADVLQTGMTIVGGISDYPSKEDLLKNAVLPIVFDNLATSEFQEFKFDGGKLKNIKIEITPPTSFEHVKSKIFSDTLFLKIEGLGVQIEADFDMNVKEKNYSGHVNIIINDLGIQIKIKDHTEKNHKDNVLSSEVNLDLSKTHSKITFSNEGTTDEIKSLLFGLVGKQVNNTFTPTKDAWIPDWGKAFTWDIGRTAYEPVNKALQYHADEMINHFVSSIPNYDITQFDIRRNLGSLSSKVSDQSDVFDSYDSLSLSNSDSHTVIKNILKSKISMFNPLIEKSLFSDKSFHSKIQHVQHQIKDDKVHCLIAPELFSKVFLSSPLASSPKATLDSELLKSMLDNNIDHKIEKYFGDTVKFSCKPTQSEPTLKGKGSEIVGTYIINCELNTVKPGEKPLYEMDIKLEFTIHPEVSEDGKGLKVNFGETQFSDVSMSRKGKTQINARVSDKMQNNYMFPGFGGLFGALGRDNDMDDFDSFLESLDFDNLNEMGTLFDSEDEMILFPFPFGFGFSQPMLIINENGVIDVSGDLQNKKLN